MIKCRLSSADAYPAILTLPAVASVDVVLAEPDSGAIAMPTASYETQNGRQRDLSGDSPDATLNVIRNDLDPT